MAARARRVERELPDEQEAPAPVPDLMAALEESLAAAKQRRAKSAA